MLLLPKDIQQSDLDLTGSVNGHHNGSAVGAALGDPHAIAQALRHADGPITIIAGEQVARDDARAELAQLRSMLRARIATVPDAKDVAGTPGLGLSSALGVTGVMGHPGRRQGDRRERALPGGRHPVERDRARGLDDALASVPTYSIGSATPFVPCTHVQTEDLRGSLRLLTQALNGDGRPTGVRVPDVVEKAELQPPAHDGDGVRYREAMAVLDAALPDGVDIVVDAGNIGASAIHYLPARRDGRFIVALGMGGMGYSFGAALGMAFGRRRRTVVIAGDGSFFMHGMEIHTALQYGLPVTFLLFDNHAHAMCVTREQLLYNDLYSYNRFGASRLGAGLAAMFPGLSAVDVDTIDDLPSALQAAFDIDGPVGRRGRVLGGRNPAIRKLSRQGRREESRYHRGEQFPCRCPRLMTSPPTEAQTNRSTELSASRRRRGRRPPRSSWR